MSGFSERAYRGPIGGQRRFGFAWALPGLLGVAAACLATSPAEAQAPGVVPLPGQEPLIGTPVVDRPRPDYDPLGIPLGGFLLSPQLQVGQSYDDNIYASQRRLGDFVTLIAPRLALDSTWSRDAVGLAVSSGISRYATHSTEDFDSVRLDAYGRLDIYRDAAVTMAGYHRHDADPRSAPETLLNQQQRAAFDEDDARIVYQQRFNRLQFTTTLDVDQYSYDQAQNQDLSRTDFIGTERAAYYFSPRINGFVQTSFDATRYTLDGPARDFETWTNLIGSAFDIDQVFFGELGVGYLHETQRNPSLAGLDTPAVRGSLLWNVTSLTSLIARAERSQEPTRLFNAFSRVRSYGSFEAQHELQRNVILRLVYSFEDNNYQGITLAQQTQTARLDARYLLNRNLTIDAVYTYRDRTASGISSALFNLGPFTENVVTINVTARF